MNDKEINLTSGNQLGKKTLQRLQVENNKLRYALNRLVNKANKVSSYHRHNVPPPLGYIDEMYEAQLEAEKVLKSLDGEKL